MKCSRWTTPTGFAGVSVFDCQGAAQVSCNSDTLSRLACYYELLMSLRESIPRQGNYSTFELKSKLLWVIVGNQQEIPCERGLVGRGYYHVRDCDNAWT